jgi:hypothetical protein
LAFVVAIPVVLFVGVFLIMVIQEWDSAYKMRVARANSDIRVIGYAAALYAKRYGHFPQQVADLAPGAGHAPGDACFLPMTPSSPWDTPYQLEIEHTLGGDKIKIWTIPDKKTQDRTHRTRFYPDPHDPKDAWPGDPDSASDSQKAGFSCDRVDAGPGREDTRSSEVQQALTRISDAAATTTSLDDAAVLAATLNKLNLENLTADLEANLSRSDKRFIGLNGYICWPSDLDKSFNALIHRFGVRCLAGTSDYIQSDRHESLMLRARKYANRYNWQLLDRIRRGDVR